MHPPEKVGKECVGRPNVKEAERMLGGAGRAVTINDHKGKGKIVIEYAAWKISTASLRRWATSKKLWIAAGSHEPSLSILLDPSTAADVYL